MHEIHSTLYSQGNSATLIGDEQCWSAQEVAEKVQTLAEYLLSHKIQRVALLADNGPAWIFADLACQLAKICLLPLPLFFTNEQIRHCLHEAGIQAVISDNMDVAKTKISSLSDNRLAHYSSELFFNFLELDCYADLPESTAKITFTSGTTGSPKGVCLSDENINAVCDAIVKATALKAPKHLCLLPLTTLLENIAGVYCPLLVGGQVVAPSLASVGLEGSSQLNIGKLIQAITTHQPTTLILIPQLLVALTTACEFGWQAPKSLTFIAVGGAQVADSLIGKARSFGLPVYEGYGLSECGSVVTLNTLSEDKLGSCGKALPHVQVASEAGELVIRGNCFLGYTGDPQSWYPTTIYTGDHGFIDEQGYVRVVGRSKNVLITSYGRNINPEWPESELLAGPMLKQCVVIGDAKPYLCALLVPNDANTKQEHIQRWINQVNHRLPDYAQIKNSLRLPKPLTAADGFLTDNGRLRRDNILRHFHPDILSLYVLNEQAS